MRRVIIILCIILGITSIIFAKGKKTLVITGSTTIFPIAQKTAEVYMNNHPDVSITVRGGGSGVGIAALIDGTTNIADASRAIKQKELKNARERGVNPIGIVIAKDGIAVIVHPSNLMNKLSLEQIKDIYTGKISNWKYVGGKSNLIVAISRDVASGTFEVFNKLALKGGRVRPDALMLASNKAVATTISTTPNAIGYVGIGYLSEDVKALKVNGIYPSLETVVNGEYELARPLFMYTNGKPKDLAKDFVDFILSPEGQKIVKEVGYVPIR